MARCDQMARSDPQLNVRIPEELKAALDRVARENGRSTTAEIIARLQASFEGGQEMPSAIRQEMEDLTNALRAERTETQILLDTMRSLMKEPKFVVLSKGASVKPTRPTKKRS
jgi:hypothetical protein